MKHFNYANVMGTLGVFLALGGSAYAAATIGSGQVVDNSLTTRDLRNGAAVRSADVVDDSVSGGGLTGRDIREGSLSKVSSARRADRAGDAETLGGRSAAQIGLRDVHVVSASSENSSEDKFVAPQCPDGEVALGGGGEIFGSNTAGIALVKSDPRVDDGPVGWVVTAREMVANNSNWRVTAEVVCAIP